MGLAAASCCTNSRSSDCKLGLSASSALFNLQRRKLAVHQVLAVGAMMGILVVGLPVSVNCYGGVCTDSWIALAAVHHADWLVMQCSYLVTVAINCAFKSAVTALREVA